MRIILFLLFMVLLMNCFGQQKDCGTRSPQQLLFIDSIAAMQQRTLITYPLTMKIFVHIVARDDGTLPAVPEADVLRQLENMRRFFAPHDICFLLTGIEQLNNTDLRVHDVSEEGELFPHLVPDVLNIFVHSTLTDGTETLNGVAYGIPNTYMSLVDGAVLDTSNLSTTAHEMGHLFGLYHTFERNSGVESIKRSGTCSNCSTAGDLLCDTPADPHTDNYDTGSFIDANCDFFGAASQFCAPDILTYQMDPTNIMAYGRRPCRDHFTNGQGNRASSIILTTSSLLTRVADDDLNITLSQTFSSGRRIIAARNSITINASAYTIDNSARAYIASAGEILIKPGAVFAPTAGTGEINVAISTLCR